MPPAGGGSETPLPWLPGGRAPLGRHNSHSVQGLSAASSGDEEGSWSTDDEGGAWDTDDEADGVGWAEEW